VLISQGMKSARTGVELPVVPMLGTSKAMREVLATIARVSRYRTNVLLLGESGTGKDLLARTLHASGPRKAARFEPQNCATLSRELLESELFGHERGSFTGAHTQKAGLFEVADGGTLFLDEIAEMDLTTQAKLLRVLEHNRFRRLGGTTVLTVDVGIIAATNRALPELIEQGRFRDDLYYRLKVVTIRVPPLRERKEDIPQLVDAFLRDFNRRHHAKLEGLTPGLRARFLRHDWPGNIRELKNAIEAAGVMSDGPLLTEADAEASDFASTHSKRVALQFPPDVTLAEVERAVVEDRLTHAPSREAAAKSLGISLRTLYARLRSWS
jgi:transcriptional regulator with PAS, ATPase and Fis domain